MKIVLVVSAGIALVALVALAWSRRRMPVQAPRRLKTCDTVARLADDERDGPSGRDSFMARRAGILAAERDAEDDAISGTGASGPPPLAE